MCVITGLVLSLLNCNEEVFGMMLWVCSGYLDEVFDWQRVSSTKTEEKAVSLQTKTTDYPS
jgi:hypothetical protein